MQFDADANTYNAAYKISDANSGGARASKSLLFTATPSAKSELISTIWSSMNQSSLRATELSKEKMLWTSLSGGTTLAYTNEFFKLRKDWFDEKIKTNTTATVSAATS